MIDQYIFEKSAQARNLQSVKCPGCNVNCYEYDASDYSSAMQPRVVECEVRGCIWLEFCLSK